jgi:hypothetical protein
VPSLASGPVAAQNAGDAGHGVPPQAPGDATAMNSKPLFWTGFGLTIAGGLLVGAATIGFAIDRLQTEQAAIGWALGGVMLGVGIPFLVVGGRQVPVAGDTAIVIGPTGGSVRVRF